MMRRASIIVALGLFGLTACGFEPVYRQQQGQTNVADVLAYIDIKAPASRSGDQLKADLEDLFYQSLQPQTARYRLETTIEMQARPFIIDPDGISSRYDLDFTSHYTLTRLADGVALGKGHLRRTVSYNVSDENDYATYISQKDAVSRGIHSLAEDYQQRIAAMVSRSLEQAP